MQANRKTFNLKLSLFAFAIICITMVFWINRIMINQLRDDARQQVEYLAKSYTEAINSENEDDIRFIMDILLPSLNFPIIITSKNEISAVMNLDDLNELESVEYDKYAWKIISKMDKTFQPLDLKWDGIKWGEIHFSDPQVISQLRWIPYIEIGFGIIFIIFSLWGFQLIRKGEKNMIYVGMAKETAHQLGTPVSSLLGWIKLLRDKKSDRITILNSMDDDVLRLSEISERFSKIGSSPKLVLINLYELILESKNYMQSRLSSNSKINLIIKGPKEGTILGDWILLRWAFENLLKNSIDAIGGKKGTITIVIEKVQKYSFVYIIDTGKGILRKNWKNIFRPGFSSKKRGWGLGLSLTMRILKEIHGGDIKVIKSQFGETIFKIKL